jgi:hypothetical protein
LARTIFGLHGIFAQAGFQPRLPSGAQAAALIFEKNLLAP